jgi:hypothetical protein
MTRLQDSGALIQKNDSDLKPPYPVFFVGSPWLAHCVRRKEQSAKRIAFE